MAEALSIFFGVVALAAGIATMALGWKAHRRLRAAITATRFDDWNTAASTIPRRERARITRATKRQQPIDDGRFAALVVARAQHFLQLRELSGHGLLRLFQAVLVAGAVMFAAIGAGTVTSWYVPNHSQPAWIVVVTFAVAVYEVIIAAVLPRIYRRDVMTLRRTIALNDLAAGE